MQLQRYGFLVKILHSVFVVVQRHALLEAQRQENGVHELLADVWR